MRGSSSFRCSTTTGAAVNNIVRYWGATRSQWTTWVNHFMTLMYLNPLFIMHPTVKFYLLNMDDCKTTAMNQRREFLAEGRSALRRTAYFDEMASEASRKKDNTWYCEVWRPQLVSINGRTLSSINVSLDKQGASLVYSAGQTEGARVLFLLS